MSQNNKTGTFCFREETEEEELKEKGELSADKERHRDMMFLRDDVINTRIQLHDDFRLLINNFYDWLPEVFPTDPYIYCHLELERIV